MAQIQSFVSTILPFLFVLGVLIFIHELGHFLVARWHGVKVLAFSLGFGPKLLRIKRGDTEYCISAIPLGGYVKLAGETIEDTRTGAPDEFLSKSKWVRFQVYIAGPLMNLALAVVLTTVVLLQGLDVAASDMAAPVIGSVPADSVGARAGLRPGDRILRVNGREVATWQDMDLEVMQRANREVTVAVQRGSEYVDLRMTPKAEGKYDIGTLGIEPVKRPQVLTVFPDKPGAKAGLQRGDVILAVNGERGLTNTKVIERIKKSPETPLVFTVERAGSPFELTIVPEKLGSEGRIGAEIWEFEVRRIDPSLTQAVVMSVKQNWQGGKMIGRILGGLFTRDTEVKALMGPVAIAEMSGATAKLGWTALLALMAMLSLNLGILNLMPVPVLDGGHIAILGLEGLSRRDLSVKVKERILMAGFALILMLMVTVIYNDVARLLR